MRSSRLSTAYLSDTGILADNFNAAGDGGKYTTPKPFHAFVRACSIQLREKNLESRIVIQVE